MATAYATKVKAIWNPPSTGEIFWVDGFAGSESNTGKSPLDPLLKIATALSLCTNDQDDYIYVLDCWQQETSWPIVVNKTRVHIIGVVNKSNRFPCMQPTGDTAIFTIGSSGNDCEIAGFNLSGGTNHGCIELTNPIGIHIHDCIFGSQHAGGTPQDGIAAISPHDPIHGLIEDCKFYGTGNNSNGLITRDGIRNIGGGASNFRNMTVRNNVFLGIPGVAINLDFAQGAMILDNKFALDADTAGAAITLVGGCLGCFIDGNSANYGDTAMGGVPYSDGGAAGANTWGLNYRAGVSIMPA